MAAVCRRSHRLDGGGLTEVQARLMLRRSQAARDAATLGRDESGFAEALARAAFHAAVPDRVADSIRREAAPLCRDRAASRVSLRERALRVFRSRP
jgi:hypothetical protein